MTKILFHKLNCACYIFVVYVSVNFICNCFVGKKMNNVGKFYLFKCSRDLCYVNLYFAYFQLFFKIVTVFISIAYELLFFRSLFSFYSINGSN